MKYMSLVAAALLLIVHAHAHAHAQPAGPRAVAISVQVVHRTAATPKAFAFHFTNPFSGTSVGAEPDEAGKLVARGELVFAQNVTVRYNGFFINLFMAPGDSLHLVVDAALLREKDFAWLSIRGDHAILSTQLSRAHQFMAELPGTRYDWQLPPEAMLRAIREDHRQKMAAFDAYARGRDLDPRVRSFIDRDVLYGISNYLTDYVADSLPADERAARIALFRDTLFGMQDTSNFRTMMFAYHLGWYAKWVTESDSVVRLAKKEERYADAMRAGVPLLLREPPGLCRDYMLFFFVQDLALKDPSLIAGLPGMPSGFTAGFVPVCLQRNIDSAFSVRFAAKDMKGVHALLPDGRVQALGAVDMLRWLGKRYAGKVVYVDVYATWCGPCRKALPYIPALQADYAGREVVFVNICVLDDMAAWRKMVKEERWGGEHYFLDADASKLFMGHYRVSGVPVYWLMDREGRLVTTYAPRPSEGTKLRKQIDGLLP